MSDMIETAELMARVNKLAKKLAESERVVEQANWLLGQERTKNERLLFLAGQMAETSVKLVGGEGNDFTINIFEAGSLSIELRDRTQRYNDAVKPK